MDVGKRLRALREMYGLSQRALAKKAGVTNGIVSMIEKNRNSPSLATLKKILDAIPIPLSEFFAEDESPQLRTFYKAADLPEIGSSGFSFRQVGGDLKGKAMQILHERIEAGAVAQTLSLIRILRVLDLLRDLDQLIPPSSQYGHEQAWHDGNGHSHLQATTVGPSITVPVSRGAPVLGTWQQIFHLECDIKPRQREIVVTVIGE